MGQHYSWVRKFWFAVISRLWRIRGHATVEPDAQGTRQRMLDDGKDHGPEVGSGARSSG